MKSSASKAARKVVRTRACSGHSSDWVSIIENLLSGAMKDTHASRLKVFADSLLKITEDLLAHIAHNSEGHVTIF